MIAGSLSAWDLSSLGSFAKDKEFVVSKLVAASDPRESVSPGDITLAARLLFRLHALGVWWSA
ncbi:MAG: hypothetical protein A2992_06785 [Elusimicrobia bacterium RIFCSPLOWO2_01_FULL_59_12]|nr:MAG: hypothetical protein A2992_06785 [Elusimicrobia bacterium RIFCSPLOWO2_01_FULL_59_12]